MLSLRLTAELEKRLVAIARKSGRSKAAIAREALLLHIEDLEDFHIAAKRLRPGRHRVSLDDLEQEYR